MDYTTLMLYIFAAVSTLYVLHFGFYLIGANAYDVWQARRRHRLHRDAVHGIAAPFEPLITVAISARNEEKTITRCLDSIRFSYYKKVQVLVVDDASTDSTYFTLQRYKKTHPELDLRIIKRARNRGKGAALSYALKRYGRGELAMTCDADSILAPASIGNAVSYFTDPRIVGVAANVQIIDDFTVLGVLQKFEHMVGYRSKKVYSLLNCEIVVGGVASTYRMGLLREVGFYDIGSVTEDIGLSMKIVARGNRENRIVYAADVVAATEGVTTFRALLKQRFRWKYGSFQNVIKYRHLIHNRNIGMYTPTLTHYRMPMTVASEFALLFAPAIWGYVIYWSLASLSLRLIVGAYMTITIYTFITIWFDENITFIQRCRLSLYAPVAYFIFYIMDVVQFVSMLKCLKRGHSLVRQKNLGSTWVSPQRVGSEVVVG
jgi:cellulose synthase/poly-beta-1,6-N-acetylglucosamine synthase-like glycosyltransferase